MLNRQNLVNTISIKKLLRPSLKRIFTALLTSLFILASGFLFYNLLFWGKIYPGIYVAGVSVGTLKPDKAIKTLSTITAPETITIKSQEQEFEIPLGSIDFSYDYSKTALVAYNIYRSGNVFYDLYNRLQAPFRKIDIGLRINLDEEKLAGSLSVIAGQIAFEPITPSISLVDEKVIISKGSPGIDVDIDKLRLLIGQGLTYAKNSTITAPTFPVGDTLTETEAETIKNRATNLTGKSLELTFEKRVFVYEKNEILKLLDFKKDYNKEAVEILILEVADQINREPQNPVFVFLPASRQGENGKVKEFTPSKDGLKVEEKELTDLITNGLTQLEKTDEKFISIAIPITTIPPDYETKDVNDLGIKELIGKGTSRFSGSILSRIHNISLASSRFNGTIIPPGEIFSFNKTLGDVSEYTGYKQAYIIKDGKTVLGDGGGVCQVSTTLFRAILDAGFPIVERRAHSYRVSYYEQDSPPGLDATVYAPTTDLKFRNDTPGHILIQTQVDTKKATLVFEIYGTSDGRTSTTSKPIVTNVVPPPEDLYEDDPTLPLGTTKQIDWKAWGAKVTFDYIVKRNGEVIYKKTFYSNYRPWQSVFLRGTGPTE